MNKKRLKSKKCGGGCNCGKTSTVKIAKGLGGIDTDDVYNKLDIAINNLQRDYINTQKALQKIKPVAIGPIQPLYDGASKLSNRWAALLANKLSGDEHYILYGDDGLKFNGIDFISDDMKRRFHYMDLPLLGDKTLGIKTPVTPDAEEEEEPITDPIYTEFMKDNGVRLSKKLLDEAKAKNDLDYLDRTKSAINSEYTPYLSDYDQGRVKYKTWATELHIKNQNNLTKFKNWVSDNSDKLLYSGLAIVKGVSKISERALQLLESKRKTNTENNTSSLSYDATQNYKQDLSLANQYNQNNNKSNTMKTTRNIFSYQNETGDKGMTRTNIGNYEPMSFGIVAGNNAASTGQNVGYKSYNPVTGQRDSTNVTLNADSTLSQRNGMGKVVALYRRNNYLGKNKKEIAKAAADNATYNTVLDAFEAAKQKLPLINFPVTWTPENGWTFTNNSLGVTGKQIKIGTKTYSNGSTKSDLQLAAEAAAKKKADEEAAKKNKKTTSKKYTGGTMNKSLLSYKNGGVYKFNGIGKHLTAIGDMIRKRIIEFIPGLKSIYLKLEPTYDAGTLPEVEVVAEAPQKYWFTDKKPTSVWNDGAKYNVGFSRGNTASVARYIDDNGIVRLHEEIPTNIDKNGSTGVVVDNIYYDPDYKKIFSSDTTSYVINKKGEKSTLNRNHPAYRYYVDLAKKKIDGFKCGGKTSKKKIVKKK